MTNPQQPTFDSTQYTSQAAADMDSQTPDLKMDEVESAIDGLSGGNGLIILKMLELNGFMLIKKAVYEAITSTSKEQFDRYVAIQDAEQKAQDEANAIPAPLPPGMPPLQLPLLEFCNCGCYSGGCARPDGCKCDSSCPCGASSGSGPAQPTEEYDGPVCALCGQPVEYDDPEKMLEHAYVCPVKLGMQAKPADPIDYDDIPF